MSSAMGKCRVEIVTSSRILATGDYVANLCKWVAIFSLQCTVCVCTTHNAKCGVCSKAHMEIFTLLQLSTRLECVQSYLKERKLIVLSFSYSHWFVTYVDSAYID